MPDHLRPNLTVEQVFVTQNPVVLPSPLDVVIMAIQRQMEWRADAGAFVGGQINAPYDFPDLNPGAVVEQPTASDPVLRPHVFIQNRFGVAEVTPSYNWTIDPPQFSLAASLSATFEISEGTTGEYSATSSRFIDANADFIEDEVAANDVIKIDGVPAFQISSLVSDDELVVTRLDKASGTYSGDLSAEDINLDRTLTDLGFDFSDVTVGDLVTVTGWSLKAQADGIDYTAETAGVRTMTNNTVDWVGVGLSGPVVGPPATIDIIWIQDGATPTPNWVPTFFATGNAITTHTAEIQNLLNWPVPTALDTNTLFQVFTYVQTDLTGGAVYTDLAAGPLVGGGSYTLPAPITLQRTFSSEDTVNINFVTLLAGLPSPLSQYFIAAADPSGAMRPLFKFAAVPAPTPPVVGVTPSTVQVVDVEPVHPGALATGAGTVTWELWDDTGLPIAAFSTATMSVENPLDSNKRTLTVASPAIDFTLPPVVVAGDIIYNDAGAALFLVTNVLGPTSLKCLNIVPGNPPTGWTDAEFGFMIMSGSNSATMRVTRIIDENTIGVRNLIAGSPPAGAFTDLLYSITVADALSDVSYTIEKTLSGSALTGTVLCTYTARRNDRLDAAFEVASDTREDLLGFAVPANPLGLAGWLALSNTPYTIWCIQVEEDTVAAWQAAIELSKTSRLYVLSALTQNETVLGLLRTHVLQQSDPDVKRERIMFQSHRFDRIETRTDMRGGDATQYTKTGSSTTFTINRDLSAYGVVVGDVIEGYADPVLGTTLQTFSGRIITISSGTTTTLTIVNANGLDVGTGYFVTPGATWTIRSKDLTDSEFADKIAAYPGTIASRRFRNVYPDSVEVTFTDDTDPSNVSGFYGGGDVVEELGGEYLAAIFAAARSGQKPGQPLSRFDCTGIHKLLNPFGDPEGGNEDLNDRIIDGGNWVASQASDDGPVFAIRALTTDVSTIYYLEDHVTVQVDNFARLLRNQIRPLLGPFNISDSFFDIVCANQEAVRTKVIDDKDAREIEFLGIYEVPDLPDTFGMDYNFTPFVTGAKGRVRIFI